MATAATYLENLIRVRDSIPVEVSKIAYKKEIEIIDLNREDQLFKNSILPTGLLSNSYKRNYKGFGRGYPKTKDKPFNFFETGAMFSAFRMKTDGFELEIYNNSPTVDAVSALAGGNIIGLTPQNEERLNWKIIYPDLMIFINKYL